MPIYTCERSEKCPPSANQGFSMAMQAQQQLCTFHTGDDQTHLLLSYSQLLSSTFCELDGECASDQ